MKRITGLKADLYISTAEEITSDQEGDVVVMVEQFINSLTVHAGEIKAFPRIHIRKENQDG